MPLRMRDSRPHAKAATAVSRLKHAETIRYAADYGGASIEFSDARQIVEQAETFIAAVKAALARKDDP